MQQSTIDSVASPVDESPWPSNHVPCPTCIDFFIVESELADCGNRIFCKCWDFACLECQCRWNEMRWDGRVSWKVKHGYRIGSATTWRGCCHTRRSSKNPCIQGFWQVILWYIGKRQSHPTSIQIVARGGFTRSSGEIIKKIETKHFSINKQFILGCREARMSNELTKYFWFWSSIRKVTSGL